jgi:FixJ family two-component response regulator
MSQAGPVVFVLDDDTRFVGALSSLLKSNGFTTRTFTCVDDFLKDHDLDCPGCLILDVRMPGVTGLELQNVLAARGVTRPIIFLSAHGDIRMSVQAMKAGAVTFLPKPVRKAELLDAVQEALRTDAVGRQRQQERADLLKKLATLTPREREVLDLVLAGKLNKQIALELCTAEKTVKSHRGHIMEKLQVRSSSALVGLFSRIRTLEGRANPDTAPQKDLDRSLSTDSLSSPMPSDEEVNLESVRD